MTIKHMMRMSVIVSGILTVSALSYAQTITHNIDNFLQGSMQGAGPAAPDLGTITDGNCQIQGILRDALFGKYSNQIDCVIKDYQGAGEALLKKADDPAFIKRLNMQGVIPMPDIDMSGVKTRADLIRLIAQTALNTASDLKTAKERNDADALQRAIADSSKLNRLILALIQIPLA